MSNNKDNNIKLHGIITKLHDDTKTKLTGKAEVDLSNVNVGAANAGKFYSVNAAGGLEFVTPPSGVLLTDIKIFKGRVLSYDEQKTTGAFADRTLFSEKAIPKGVAIVGGTGGVETAGQVGELPIYDTVGVVSNTSDLGVGTGTSTQKLTKIGDGTLYYSGSESGQRNYNVGVSVSGNLVNVGKDNLAKGIEIVAYVYTALKDITFAEMGNTGGNNWL